MLEMAEKTGVKAMKRPEQYADESVPFGCFLDYLCEVMPNDHILWACVTSPLVESSFIERQLQLILKSLRNGMICL
jgi:N-acylneuraminate cytidylyltransferase